MNATRAKPGGWPALIVAGLSVSLILIDGFIISAAAPYLIEAFGMKPAEIGRVIAAYAVPLACLPLVAGTLGDRYGIRRVFSAGIFLFIVASVFCAGSDSVPELLFWRVVQGTGAALVSPQTLAAASGALGEARRGFAIGIWGSISAAGLLFGPLAGGATLAHLPWRWVLIVNLPLGIAALICFLAFVPRQVPAQRHGKLDLPLGGILLLVLSLCLVALPIPSIFQGSGLAAILFLGGLVLLAAWTYREMRPNDGQPRLVGAAILRNGKLLSACLGAFAMNASSAGTVAVVGFCILRASGEADPVLTGMLFLPGMLAVLMLMPWTGKLAQQTNLASRRWLAAATIATVLAPALTGLSLLADAEPHFLPAAAAITLQGLGAAFVLSYVSFSAIVAVPADRIGTASGALSMSRNLGTAIGAATLTGAMAMTDKLYPSFAASVMLATLSIPFLLQYLGKRRRRGEGARVVA